MMIADDFSFNLKGEGGETVEIVKKQRCNLTSQAEQIKDQKM